MNKNHNSDIILYTYPDIFMVYLLNMLLFVDVDENNNIISLKKHERSECDYIISFPLRVRLNLDLMYLYDILLFVNPFENIKT